MNKERWINIVLFAIIFSASGYGIWDHWFRPKDLLIKKLILHKSELAAPADPFSSEDMNQYNQIKMLHNTGNYEGALKLAQSILESSQGEPNFRDWLQKQIVPLMTSVAWLKIQMNDCDEAQKILYRTIKIGPISETKKALGFCLHTAKNWPEAASWLTSYVFEKPNDLEGRILLADSLESLGRFDEALIALEGALAIDSLTDEQKQSLSERIQAMKVKAREGVRQKSEYSRRFYVSFREEEHENILPSVFEILESSTDEFSEVLGLEPFDAPIEVVLYRKDAFQMVIPGGPSWSEGVFDGRIRVPVSSDMKSRPNDLLATILRHELSHALMSKRVKEEVYLLG